MTKQVHTTSTEGFAATSDVAGEQVRIDATGETAPDTLEYLLATYASCYVPAFRVAAEQRDVGDLGEISIDVTGELNESDKLEAIAFDVSVDADLDPDQAAAVLERAESLCKVHDALKDSLGAQITIDGHGS